MIESLAEVGTFLLKHADLVNDLYEVLASGASKESVKRAIRAIKVQVSDAAVQEELGFK